MNPDHTADETAWPEAIATVTACKFNAGAGRALAFGLPTTKHFRIAYNYFAPNADGIDELHTGEFSSEKPVSQGTLFPIRYNPDQPHHNSRDASSSPQNPQAPILIIGVIGSIILSLAWFAILRGCH